MDEGGQHGVHAALRRLCGAYAASVLRYPDAIAATRLITHIRKWSVSTQVAFLNVLIVMQDWDFPDFSEGEIKISALDIKALKFEHCFEWLRKHLPPIYVSGKWVNYLGVLMGMGLNGI